MVSAQRSTHFCFLLLYYFCQFSGVLHVKYTGNLTNKQQNPQGKI